jgi:glycerol-3-phosphate O-acyltransferase
MEGTSYIGELSGKPRQKESCLSLLRGARQVLREHYGHVALSFGEPIELTPLLEASGASWRDMPPDPEAKPEWLAQVVETLAEKIQVNINASADVNPINLLALTLLATPKHAMAESDLLTQLDLTASLLTGLPYSDRVTVTNATPAQIIAYGEDMGWIQRIKHPLGDVLSVDDEKAVLLSYFRNNVLHLIACGAWVATCFINNKRMNRTSVLRLGQIVYPFIRGELFLRWDEDEFREQLQATIDFFIGRGLLEPQGDERKLKRGRGGDDTTFQLRVIARSLMQAFERYYIAIAALVKNGPHSMSAGELEKTCILTAQRLGLLQELTAPEFFDKSLFRGFIQRLRERKMLWTDEDGKLDFDPALNEVVRDARVVLNRDVRHSILKITPSAEDEPETPTPAEDS